MNLTATLNSIAKRKSNDKKKRNGLEIIAEMLEASRDGCRKTKIMYSANLSYDLLTGYLSILVESGLLEADKDRRFFLTIKGEDYLREFRELQEIRDLYVTKERVLSKLINHKERTRELPLRDS